MAGILLPVMGVTACGNQSAGTVTGTEAVTATRTQYLMEEITPQEIDAMQEISVQYQNGGIYLLNSNRLYQMSSDGKSIREIALSRESGDEIIAFAADEARNLYLLEKTKRTEQGMIQGAWRFLLTSGTNEGPSSPEEEYQGYSGPRSPEEDDGSYVEDTGNSGFGPWNDPDMTSETAGTSGDGPWNDPEAQNGNTGNNNYGPWNDDGSSGDAIDQSGQGPWNDADARDPGNEGGPASGGGTSAPGSAGNNATTADSYGTGSANGAQGAAAGSGRTGATAGSGGTPAPGNAQGAGETPPTRPEGLPEFLPILPEEETIEKGEEADSNMRLIRYDTQGNPVWEIPVDKNAVTLMLEESAGVVSVSDRTQTWYYRMPDGTNAQGSGDVEEGMRSLSADDLTEDERAMTGDDFDLLIDIGEQGKLVVRTDEEGRHALFRLYRE